MEELVIASNNQGKIREIKAMIDNISLLSLKDVGFDQEIEEPYDTFNENAAVKAETVHKYCGKNVFADDSGICVPALDGKPGVHSAYYAGLPRDNDRNLEQLIEDMANKEDRSAYYKAVICLVWNGETHYFEGECHGTLAKGKVGTGGFGYDPIFIPNGYNQTFGELPQEVKNKLSHRGVAVRKMVDFIKEQLAS